MLIFFKIAYDYFFVHIYINLHFVFYLSVLFCVFYLQNNFFIQIIIVVFLLSLINFTISVLLLLFETVFNTWFLFYPPVLQPPVSNIPITQNWLKLISDNKIAKIEMKFPLDLGGSSQWLASLRRARTSPRDESHIGRHS